MNELDISNYLTPRYLAELIDDNEYYINLRIYSERYDWDLAMALETIYVEIGLRQCGRRSPFFRESFKGNLVGKLRKFYRSADWKSSCIIISSWKSYIF